MRVLIVEDEAPAFRRLQKLLEETDPNIEIVEVFDGVKDAVVYLEGNESFDLIFMDIQLSDGISFEIFDQVEIRKPVIFTTAFDEYMLRAFKVNSIDYLLKPINQEDLARGLDKYRSLKSQLSEKESASNLQALLQHIQINDKKYKSRFLVKMGDKLVSVETENISCFQAKNGLVYLINKEGKKYLVDQPLDDIGKDLDPERFYRVNRQYIMSYGCIKAVHKLGKGKLMVESAFDPNEQIVVSSEKSAAFKEWLG